MLKMCTEIDASSDMHDHCIDLRDLPDGQIYYRTAYCRPYEGQGEESRAFFGFFSDEPITNEVLENFWKEFYGEDY